MNTLLVACLTLALLPNQVAQSRNVDLTRAELLADLKAAYLEAHEPSRRVKQRKQAYVHRLTQMSRERRLSRENRIAVLYGMALLDGGKGAEVDALVRASCDGPVDEYTESLPPALYKIYKVNRSERARIKLATLYRDGAVGEIFAGVRYSMCRDYPDEVGRHLLKKYKTTAAATKNNGWRIVDPMIDGACFEMFDDPIAQRKLYSMINGRSTTARRFLKQSLELGVRFYQEKDKRFD